ncbi:MAG: GNAT family N-acetyltransferase [Rhodospirillales bacterium]|nr:GNAT family N-acetyltransferase [Rhodospirillales bacterium]
MGQHISDSGLPVGFPLGDWKPVATPPRTVMTGHYCRLEPIDPERHAGELHAANLLDTEDRIWTYLPYGPFKQRADYQAWMEQTCLGDDPLFHAIVDSVSGKAVGVASYLRIDPTPGVIEVGHINYSPVLQRTPAATEAMYLMMKRVFDELGYRRYEWKCDSLNARSRNAAARYGFTAEGVFRQATVYKGRNRDTAWFSVLDSEWPGIRAAYEAWLSPENLGDDGVQRESLSNLMAQHR